MDPVSELIKVLGQTAPRPAAGESGTYRPPHEGGQLAEAGKLIPGRAETTVEDLLESPELVEFRRQYRTGRIEAEILRQAFDLLRGVLTAYSNGIL